MSRVTVFAAFSLFALLAASGCGILFPVEKTTHIGRSREDVLEAIKEGKVTFVQVETKRGDDEPIALLLDLRDGEKWALNEKNNITDALVAVDNYNTTAPDSKQISVKRVTLYGGASPKLTSPEPTSAPRPPSSTPNAIPQ